MEIYLLDIENVNINKELLKQKFKNRIEESNRFLNDRDKKSSLGVAYLLDKYLKISEDDIYYNEFKKPYTKNIFFNVSHSGNYVALVKDKKEVGIDIELIDKDKVKFSNKIFTQSELDWINEKDSDNRFFYLWVIKESVIKAIGKGLSVPLQTIDININENYVLVENQKIYFQVIKIDKFYLSVASRHFIKDIDIKKELKWSP